MGLLTCLALIATGYFLNTYLNKKEGEVKYWDGPTPSKEEQNKNQNWISDHLVEFPASMVDLGKNFPQATNRAKAVIIYNRLEELRKRGGLGDIDYQTELEKILPFIDITEDLK